VVTATGQDIQVSSCGRDQAQALLVSGGCGALGSAEVGRVGFDNYNVMSQALRARAARIDHSH